MPENLPKPPRAEAQAKLITSWTDWNIMSEIGPM